MIFICPPEYIGSKFEQIDGKSDVYAFGYLLFEIWTRENPFACWETKGADGKVSYNIQEFLVAVAQGWRPDISKLANLDVPPTEYLQLILDCWHQEPHKRPAFQTILQRLSML
jgi:mitogen-activated protein kinase kinase kinase 11